MEVGQRSISLRGGKIILHTRSLDPHGIWHCRLRLGPDRKLVRRSTRTSDLNEAKVTAEEIYDDLRYKHINKQLLTVVRFEQVSSDFMRKVERETAEGRLSRGRCDLIAGTIKRYLDPFFGKFIISELSSAHFTEYDEWRLDYWTTGYGASRQVYRKAIIPAQKTLMMEQGILKQVLNHAVAQGWLSALPYMRTKTAKTNRRSAFNVADYSHLLKTAMRRARKTKHPRIRHYRQLLYYYIRLLANTGMRIGEARSLIWRNIEFITINDDGLVKKAVRIWVDGKTGKRALIGTMVARNTLERLLTYSGFATLVEAHECGGSLFTGTDGEAIGTFEVGFKALLKAASLTKDRFNNNRTLYCLRHTYATNRLLYGDTNVYLLAKNMGTSVQMIEKHYGHVTTSLAADKLL